jgi:uncharacterized membrane-anchored protein
MEQGWKKILEITAVMLIVLVIIMIIFASLRYGFTFLRKQISSNVILYGNQKVYSIDNAFKVILSIGVAFLMIFLLSQVLSSSRKTLKRAFHYK